MPHFGVAPKHHFGVAPEKHFGVVCEQHFGVVQEQHLGVVPKQCFGSGLGIGKLEKGEKKQWPGRQETSKQKQKEHGKRKFGMVLFAHLLKDLEPMQVNCRVESEVFHHVAGAASQLGTNLVELKNWDALIHASCHSRNLSLANCSTTLSGTERTFRALLESVAESKATIGLVRTENKELREEVAALKGDWMFLSRNSVAV